MDPEKWELLGVLTKTQGRSGELLLKVKKDFPSDFDIEDPVFIPVERDDEGIPFYLRSCERIRRSQYAARFDLIDDEKRASRLVGFGVWLPRASFSPDEREEKLLEKLEGFRVVDREKGDLGPIEGGIERSEQPVAYVGPHRIPIPLSDSLIERIDEEERILYMDLPEGLTDL